MSAITFNTHKFLIEEKLSTKLDLQELEAKLTYQLTSRFDLMLTVAVTLLVATLISFN